MKLSHKDLVKLGRYEAGQGYSLNKIEADFLKKGVKKEDAMKALDEVDYYNKLDQSNKDSFKKQEAKKDVSENKLNTGSNKKKSLFFIWVILLVLMAGALYIYFSGSINFDWLRSITFK